MVEQSEKDMSDTNHVVVRFFGDFCIEVDGQNVAMPATRKSKALLAYLLASAGEWTSREWLASLLWSDRQDKQARASLRQALYSLGDFSTGPMPLLIVGRSHLSVDRKQISSDTDALRFLGSDPAGLSELIGDAPLDFLHGYDGISEYFDDWLRLERARRHDERRILALAAAKHDLSSGSGKIAVGISAALLVADSCDEEAAQIGMAAYSKSGDDKGASRIFMQLEAALRFELDVAPSPETLKVRDALDGGALTASVHLQRQCENEQTFVPPAAADNAPATCSPNDQQLESSRDTYKSRKILLASLMLALLVISGAIIALAPYFRSAVPSSSPTLALGAFRATGDVPAATTDALRSEVANELRSSPLSLLDLTDAPVSASGKYHLSATVTQSSSSTRLIATFADGSNVVGTIPLELGIGRDDLIARRAAYQLRETLDCYFEAITLDQRLLPRDTKALWLRMCNKDIDNLVAVETSRQLTKRLPDLSDAWSAQALAAAYRYDSFSERSYQAEADSAARRALEIDPRNGDALVALEMLLPKTDYEKREELDSAAVGSRSSLCHCNRIYYAGILYETGRINDALIQAKAAIDENPYEPVRGAWLADLYRLNGNLTESNRVAAEFHALWPDQHFDRLLLVNAITERDVEALRSIVASEVRHARMRTVEREAFLALATGFETGNPADLEVAGDKLTSLSLNEATNGIRVIEALAILKRDEAAAKALHQYVLRSPHLIGEIYSPTLREVRQLPTVAHLVQQTRLAAFWKKTGRSPDICRTENFCDRLR